MMNREEIARAVRAGETVLGLELGSTRIKAVLIGPEHAVPSPREHDWKTGWKTDAGPIPGRRLEGRPMRLPRHGPAG